MVSFEIVDVALALDLTLFVPLLAQVMDICIRCDYCLPLGGSTAEWSESSNTFPKSRFIADCEETVGIYHYGRLARRITYCRR